MEQAPERHDEVIELARILGEAIARAHFKHQVWKCPSRSGEASAGVPAIERKKDQDDGEKLHTSARHLTRDGGFTPPQDQARKAARSEPKQELMVLSKDFDDATPF